MKTLILVITLMGTRGAAAVDTVVIDRQLPVTQCEAMARKLKKSKIEYRCQNGYCWTVHERRQGLCI